MSVPAAIIHELIRLTQRARNAREHQDQLPFDQRVFLAPEEHELWAALTAAKLPYVVQVIRGEYDELSQALEGLVPKKASA